MNEALQAMETTAKFGGFIILVAVVAWSVFPFIRNVAGTTVATLIANACTFAALIAFAWYVF
ncbi:hypothetical protein [Thauera linaloolentis]|uniref:Uncharacterized protein n=1 Tax=Thauera linaloolentis (strain DSM 12138 / JCM 21573 / CCUG 41526 / CIP 105981 / IAM 15112 / NBRC 102519 / 47Lol) TaxID=1123367 RepID=N6Z3H6_THAL4|nr:hypothetical protein [Thauera linaloolentis]ENO86709.1 hypothetical protein C666_12670 [Thauera linaloolentis 47Lol = DSM 12138]MCM8566192.1 hypothetical protein [Thauera linaloolentis]